MDRYILFHFLVLLAIACNLISVNKIKDMLLQLKKSKKKKC